MKPLKPCHFLNIHWECWVQPTSQQSCAQFSDSSVVLQLFVAHLCNIISICLVNPAIWFHHHSHHQHLPKLLLRLLHSPNHPDICCARGTKVILCAYECILAIIYCICMVSGDFEDTLHLVIFFL